jgi:SAM-dependent methyltransferase
MRGADWWLGPEVDSLLDVGCNVGAWLADCATRYPDARLAGVEINETALDVARSKLRRADLHRSGAEKLPFPDGSFQCVTCFEVLEHVPEGLRATAFREMHRVLRPAGRLIMTVPHAGWFAWLDSNNVRFRLPALYGRVVGRGQRDSSYAALSREVEWHHHFSAAELLGLAGAGWKTVAIEHGGLMLYPVADWLSWPFYRLNAGNHPLRRALEHLAAWDYRIDYGRASYGILLVLERDG